MCNVEYEVTVCGDINFRHTNWTDEVVVTNLLEHEATFAAIVTINGLTQLVKEPTCNENIFDLLFINNPLAIYNVAVISLFYTSDHNTVTWFPLDSLDVCTASRFYFKYANYGFAFFPSQ